MQMVIDLLKRLIIFFQIVIYHFNYLIYTSSQFHISHITSVGCIVIDIHIHLGNFMCHNLYRGDMIVSVKIIRIEQSILFGEK